ncbi:MAG: hypothetical protein D3908_09840 [Candidatus Electrothrix sp. AUS4]|nr:hypothetical protein [Candidatus Electrothrix sp. AUS4]
MMKTVKTRRIFPRDFRNFHGVDGGCLVCLRASGDDIVDEASGGCTILGDWEGAIGSWSGGLYFRKKGIFF